jgi:hypothetical protein
MPNVRILKKGNKIKITDDFLYGAMWDRQNDILIFYRPDFVEGGESLTSIDGEVIVSDGEIQSVALFGPKVRMIENWIRDQIESVGLGDEHTF